ncbi:hypothetical protein BELL_0069g00230 [Botrytis elliptica]|uniref:Uncharacterized protein n=1 Tax=Botrytis elliptica TaxID=278938 RepID=A0A4Z1K313_9HELO|nr:hypothetical protein BELL_0069g00230 [Botrytis elliptica]
MLVNLIYLSRKLQGASIYLLELYFGYSDDGNNHGFGDRKSDDEKVCGGNGTAIKIAWGVRVRIAIEPAVARYIQNADFSTCTF